MRVVCDNCGATYKIPDAKLTKEVNKATCRKCKHRMLIRRPGSGGGRVLPPSEEKTQITGAPVRSTAPAPDETERPTVVLDEALPAPARPAAPVRARQSAPPVPATAAPVAQPQAPAPQPAPAPAPAAPAFDPSGDLAWVLLGCAAAGAGALLLAVNIGGDPLLRIVGTALALFGSALGFLVLLTGSRGRQPANTAVSVLLAVIVAGIGVGGVIAAGQAMMPVTPAAPPVTTVAPTPAPAPADDGASDLLAEEEPEPEPEADPEPAAAPAPRAAPAPVPVRGTGRDVAPASTPAPAPAPAPPPPPERTGPPIEPGIIETIVTSNERVKRCYMDEKQRSGTLPRQIKMIFTVQPTGSVSKARVTTAEYKGSDLDICLGGAFRSLIFPPFEGEPYATGYVIRI